MADRINFSKKINDSVQAGDDLYYMYPGWTIPILVGTIINIDEKYVEVADGEAPSFLNDTFFMFRKPVEENVSSLKGYYAETTFTNSSITKQELFAVGSEITMSSK